MARSHGLYTTALIAGVGLTVGALSFLVQGRLPGDWAQIGNSGAVWLVTALFMGALVRSPFGASLAGFAALAACLIGYFVTGTVSDVPYAWYYIGLWFGVALVGGPVFGLAGRGWRDERRWAHVSALGLLGGVFIAEGIFTLLVNTHLSTGWPLIAVGVLIPLLFGRSWRDRLWGVLALVPAVILGGAAYAVVNGLTA